jgi:hypothetical protein
MIRGRQGPSARLRPTFVIGRRSTPGTLRILGNLTKRYHFHLVDSQTVADKGGQELPDNATAERVAKRLAERLRGDLPHNFSVVVTDEDGEWVCRIPIDLSN